MRVKLIPNYQLAISSSGVSARPRLVYAWDRNGLASGVAETFDYIA